MKKSSVLLAAVAAVSLAFAAQGEKQSDRSLKVLMIGNSFSICNLKQMPQVAESMGKKLDIASLYIGGCSLERHWRNVEAAATNATFKPYRFDRITYGKHVVEKDKANIPDVLTMDK